MVKKLAGGILGNQFMANLGCWFNRHRPLVLLYHGVTDHKSFPGIENYHGKHISATDFQRQIRWLKKHFKIVSLKEMENNLEAAADQPLCALTFDDGYKNNFDQAFPILQTEAVTATFFLTGNFIEKRQPLWTDRLEFAINHCEQLNLTLNFAGQQQVFSLRRPHEKISANIVINRYLKHCSGKTRLFQLREIEEKNNLVFSFETAPNYSPLSWTEIKIMSRAGMIFGNHTLNHPILSQLSSAEQEKEIYQSQKLIAGRLGTVSHFAYPNGQSGDWDVETLRILRSLGWRYAWTTNPRRIRPAKEIPLLLPRLTIQAHHDFNIFRALVSSLVLR